MTRVGSKTCISYSIIAMGRVVLEVRVDTETPHDTEEDQYVVILTGPNGHRSKYGGLPQKITIHKPELWWPNCYGAQPPYKIEVRLMRKRVLRDAVKNRIGLRTMTVDTAQDELGHRFTHAVNGVHIFAVGANYMGWNTSEEIEAGAWEPCIGN